MDSIITWMGGKKALREQIAKYIPQDITGFIEPFGGAGWVMLYKERWARLEVWNDLDRDLYNMFMQIKFHPEEIKREMKLMLHSRAMFETMLAHRGITEIQRAARFVFLIRHSFGALGSSFGTGRTASGGGCRVSLPIERVDRLSKRLDMVTVENLDYRECLRKYDAISNFFYFDPPYSIGHEYRNAKKFDHAELAEQIKSLKARWLLSYDDSPLIRDLYKDYRIVSVVRKQGISGTSKDYKEVLVMGFDESEECRVKSEECSGGGE